MTINLTWVLIFRCELWAKFIFPDRVSTIDLQRKLHSEHRMLCQKHFKDDDFTDDSKKLLLRNAFPSDVSKQVLFNVKFSIFSCFNWLQKVGSVFNPVYILFQFKWGFRYLNAYVSRMVLVYNILGFDEDLRKYTTD